MSEHNFVLEMVEKYGGVVAVWDEGDDVIAVFTKDGLKVNVGFGDDDEDTAIVTSNGAPIAVLDAGEMMSIGGEVVGESIRDESWMYAYALLTHFVVGEAMYPQEADEACEEDGEFIPYVSLDAPLVSSGDGTMTVAEAQALLISEWRLDEEPVDVPATHRPVGVVLMRPEGNVLINNVFTEWDY